MPQTADYYKTLGVSRSATTDEIRAAYRALARKLHPDVNKAPDAASRFNEVQEAYDVLSDPEKRKAYDQFGHAGVGGRAGPQAGDAGGPHGRTYTWRSTGDAGFDVGDFASIFEEFMGGRAGADFRPGPGPRAARRPEPRRPARDIHHTIEVPFLVAAKGGSEEIRLTRPDGTIETVSVRIPAGIESGSKLRLRGRGAAAPPGQPPGDLLLTINVAPHPWFDREGLDIRLTVPVTIAEAALGTTVTVPLLDGRADLRVPPGSSSGRLLRLKGKGLGNEKGQQGDFYAVIQVAAPADLNEADQASLKSMGERLKNPRKSLGWADNVG